MNENYDLTAPHLPYHHPKNVELRLRSQLSEVARERDALQARIDGAPVHEVARMPGACGFGMIATTAEYAGKRVALVLLDTEQTP